MLSALLVALTLALDPLGEPHALKRALLLALAPVLFLVAWRGGKLARIANAPLGAALTLGFLGIGLRIVTQPFVDSQGSGIESLCVAFLCLLCCVVARDQANERPYAFTLTALILGGLSAIYAILQRIGFDPLFDNLNREAVSFFGNTNRAGEFLAPIVPLALASLRSARSACRRTGALALPLATAALVLTSSRGAVIAAGCGVVAILLTRRLRIQELVILGLGIVFPFLVDGVDSYRLKTVEESEAAITSPEYAPNKQRLALLESTVAMIQDAPLLGYGAGSFRAEFGRFRDPAEARLPTALGVLSSAEDPHNQYLLFAAEYGIPGALLLLAVLVLALFASRHARAWPAEHPLRDTAPGYAAALVALLVLGLFRAFLEHAPVAWLTYGFAGGLLALAEPDRERAPRPLATLLLPVWLIGASLVGLRALHGQIYVGVAARALERQDALGAEAAYRTGRRFGGQNIVLLVREAALLEQHSRLDRSNAALRKEALASRERLAEIDPWNATNHLRLAAASLSTGAFPQAQSHLDRVSKILGERSAWELACRLAASGEFDSAIRYLVHSAQLRRISISELRGFAETHQSAGKTALALLALYPCLELRPEDGDLALAIGGLLKDGDPQKAEHLRRGHIAIALAALTRRDSAAALKSLQLARRYPPTFELAVAYALTAALDGDESNLEAVLEKRPEEGPALWLEPMLKPLRSIPELAKTFQRIDESP